MSKWNKLFQCTDKSLFKFKKFDENPTYLLRPESDLISSKILATGSWEPDLIQKSKEFIDENSFILDIGANIGVWSVELSRAASKGKIYSFEPQPETFKQLCANLFINGCENVIPYQIALGKKSDSGKTLMMKIDSGNNGGSKITENGNIPVMAMSLSDYSFPQKIDMIKIDVEGYELNVLDGAEELILKDKPVVFFEAWFSKRKALITWFESRGYSVHKFKASDFYAVPKDYKQKQNINSSNSTVKTESNKKRNKKAVATSSINAVTVVIIIVVVIVVLGGVGIIIWKYRQTHPEIEKNDKNKEIPKCDNTQTIKENKPVQETRIDTDLLAAITKKFPYIITV